MDAIVTAGGIPEEGEPLYEYTRGKPKALVDIAGKPMIQWVLDAMSASRSIGQVVLVGLPEDSGVTCTKPLTFLENQGSMLGNIFAGGQKVMSSNPNAKVLLTVSSDIPSITGEIVDWMAGECSEGDHDVYYNFITREDMDNRFPGSKRTFTRFKDYDVCGGDLTGVHSRMLTSDGGVWMDLISARKNILKQAAIIGYGTLFLLLFRQLSIESAVRRVSERLQIRARAIKCPYPEIGMDVDKPYQMELLRADLAQRRGV